MIEVQEVDFERYKGPVLITFFQDKDGHTYSMNIGPEENGVRKISRLKFESYSFFTGRATVGKDYNLIGGPRIVKRILVND